VCLQVRAVPAAPRGATDQEVGRRAHHAYTLHIRYTSYTLHPDPYTLRCSARVRTLPAAPRGSRTAKTCCDRRASAAAPRRVRRGKAPPATCTLHPVTHISHVQVALFVYPLHTRYTQCTAHLHVTYPSHTLYKTLTNNADTLHIRGT
jgi:hypothetical protein